MPGETANTEPKSRLVTPRRPESAESAAPVPRPSEYLVDIDSSTPPIQVAEFEDCSWWGASEKTDSRPSRHDTPLPDQKLDWNAIAAVGAETEAEAEAADGVGEEPVVALANSPCPCGAGQTLAGRSWCLKCGYDSDHDKRRAEREAAGATETSRVPREFQWLVRSAPALVFALFGSAAILAVTVYRREIVPDRTDLRVWWTGIEAIVGVVLYIVGHISALVLTVRYWKDSPPSILDPIGVWRYAAQYMPRTRWAFALASWGATCFTCAFVLFWLNDYAFRDKTAKPPLRNIEAPGKSGQSSGKPSDSKEDDGPAVINYGTGTNKANGTTKSDGPTKPETPSLAIERTQSATAVVIGYEPDPADPSKIGRLALGQRMPDGTIKFAGYADVDKTNGDGGVGQIASLKKLLVAPDYVPDKGIVPVEPTLNADVKFSDRDSAGVLRNSLVTGVVGEKDKK